MGPSRAERDSVGRPHQPVTAFFTTTGTFRTIAAQIESAVVNPLTGTFQPAR